MDTTSRRRTSSRGPRRIAVVALLAGLAWATVGTTWSEDRPGRVGPPKNPVVDLMEQKLSASQGVLSGLVRGDMKLVGRSADVLQAIARSDDWERPDEDAVFSHFHTEFQRQSEKLAIMAERNNLEGAAYIYNQVTATCIGCHEHVRDVKRVPKILPLSDQRPE